jgi:hypothetical protein
MIRATVCSHSPFFQARGSKPMKKLRMILDFVALAAVLCVRITATAKNFQNGDNAQQCSVPGAWSSIWMSCPAGDSVSNNFPPIGALLLQSGLASSDEPGGYKGRLNLMAPYAAMAATHLITLGDSNPAKTLATPGHRPSNDANDTWIGLDNPQAVASSFQLAFGAPVSISSYIGAVGNPLTDTPREKLDKNFKTFNNVQIVSTRKTSAGAPFSIVSTAPVDNLTLSNHPRMQYCGTTGTCSDTQPFRGQIVFGTIQLSSGTATLQGINPPFAGTFNCVANDTTNPANGVNAIPKPGNPGQVLFTGTGSDFVSYQCVGS